MSQSALHKSVAEMATIQNNYYPNKQVLMTGTSCPPRNSLGGTNAARGI